MHSYLGLLSEIENDPKKFLGSPSLEKLDAFMTGWTISAMAVSYPRGNFSDKFRSWIMEKYGGLVTLNASSIIQLMAGNEYDAFYSYFDELRLFRKKNPECFESECVLRNKEEPWPPKDRRILIETIVKKPGMYMGRKTITSFRAFLDGDAYARLQENPDAGLYADLSKLEAWLNIDKSFKITPRCEALGLLYNGGDGEAAFDWLYEQIVKYENERTEASRVVAQEN